MQYMNKTQLFKAKKADVVSTALKAQEQLVIAKENETRLEEIIWLITQATEQLLIDIDLPRKFSFWWALSNLKALISFVEKIVTALKANKNKIKEIKAKIEPVQQASYDELTPKIKA